MMNDEFVIPRSAFLISHSRVSRPSFLFAGLSLPKVYKISMALYPTSQTQTADSGI